MTFRLVAVLIALSLLALNGCSLSGEITSLASISEEEPISNPSPTPTPATIETAISGFPLAHDEGASFSVSVSTTVLGFYKYKYGLASATDCSNQMGYSSAGSSLVPILISNLGPNADELWRLCVIGGDLSGRWQDLSSAATVLWNRKSQPENIFQMCGSVTSTDQSSGTLYDSGGVNGPYSSGENCQFQISSASPLTLQLESGVTESGYDFLTIYDGDSNTGNLLYDQSGALAATSFNISSLASVVFSSDSSVQYDGFVLSWGGGASDYTPDNFTFANVINGAPDTFYTRRAVVTGIRGHRVVAAIDGLTAQIRNVTQSSSWGLSVLVEPGDTVEVRMKSPATSSESRSATVRIGNQSQTWSIYWDFVQPHIVDITSSNANGTYLAGDQLWIDVKFSEPVTLNGGLTLMLATGSSNRVLTLNSGGSPTALSDTLSFSYLVSDGESSNDLDCVSSASLALVSGTLHDEAGLNAQLALPAPGASGSLSANKDLKIALRPRVTGMSLPADKTYDVNEALDFTLTFSESVSVTGSPSIGLTIGSSNVNATYLSGSGTNQLVFRYFVHAGELDSDGITVATTLTNASLIVSVNSGAGASSALPSVTSAGILVDTNSPVIQFETVSGYVSEGSAGTWSAKIISSKALPQDVTIQLKIAGTATLGVDYTSSDSPGAIILPAGATQKTITITVLDDALVEGDETVILSIDKLDGKTLGTAQTAVLVIADDDSGARDTYLSVAAGSNFSCALTDGGAVKCWGLNNKGQLGSGDLINYQTPHVVQGLSNGVTKITAGPDFACALLASGGVKCWGSNTAGQLGNGTTNDLNTPVSVSTLTDATAIGAGKQHACALSTANGVMCWGSNSKGQLGNNGTVNSLSPVVSTQFPATVTKLAPGGTHTCVLLASGEVKCLGENFWGQLGNNSTVDSLIAVTPVGLSSGVTDLSSGWDHSCAVLNGAAKCWGTNSAGQLARGYDVNQSSTPISFGGWGSGVQSIFASSERTCLLSLMGKVYCVGRMGTNGYANTIYQLVGSENAVLTVGNGFGHTCWVDNLRKLSCAGANLYGELGTGQSDYSPTPHPLFDFSNIGFLSIQNNCAIDTGFQTRCWGDSDRIMSSLRTERAAPMPIFSPAVPALKSITFSPGGYATRDHSWCGVTPAGEGLCWGLGESGALGNGSDLDSPIPVNPTGLSSSVSEIYAGSGFRCAHLTNGSVKCWGSGFGGKIGNGSETDSLVPADVTGLASNVTTLQSNSYHSCAIQLGALKCWGINFSGQLGVGDSTNRTLPVQPIGMGSGVTAVGVGSDSTCAVQSGAVKCWGSNWNGVLGDGTTNYSSTPVQVVGLNSGVTQVQTYYYHSCALMSGGNIKCWGDNTYGQLGTGDYVSSLTPVDVIGLPAPAVKISVGSGNTCALLNTNQVYCWGISKNGVDPRSLGDFVLPYTYHVMEQ